MLSRLRAVGRLCLFASATQAGPLVLTGHSRLAGETWAFFRNTGNGSFFSLRAGEDSGVVQLVEVNFREHWALIVDATGTNQVGFAARETQTVSRPKDAEARLTLPSPSRRSNRPLPPGQDLAEVAANSLGSPEDGGDSLASDNPGRRVGPAAEPSSDESAVTEVSGLPPRATADELFKTRKGHAAWDSLVHQRHLADMQAEALAAGH